VTDSCLDLVAALRPFGRAESVRLRRYVSYADDLAQCSFLSEKLSFSLRMTRGEPYKVEGREGDEAIDAWLRRFRVLHLVGRDGSATFASMSSLVGSHLRNTDEGERLREALRRCRRALRTAHDGTGLQLHIDTGQVRPGHALEDWLNGVYFHDDEDKLGRVETLRSFGFHHHLALCAGRDLSRIYLGFSTHVVKPVTEEPALVAAPV
jgi:hypothetical protein